MEYHDGPKQLLEKSAEGTPERALPIELWKLAYEYHARVDWEGNPYPITAWLHEREQVELVYQASRADAPAGHIIEIGQGWAASTFLLARGNEFRAQETGRNEHLFSFDPLNLGSPPNPSCDSFRAMVIHRALTGSEHQAHTIRGTSDLIVDMFRKDSCRLAFIDGDHSEEWCRRDLEAILPCMVDGGLILIHDVYDVPDPQLCSKVFAESNGLSIGGATCHHAGYIVSLGLLEVTR